MHSPVPTRHDPWVVPTVPVADVLAAPDARVVDLRSPSEFAADHLPGARNVPLFDDAERALIGTLYKRRSPEEAFDEGRRLVLDSIAPMVEELARVAGRPSPREDLGQLVAELTAGGIEEVHRALTTRPAALPPANALFVHCWRGGLRSGSLVTLLRQLGWEEVVSIEGGYKSYRKHLLAELDAWQAPPAFVLRGGTGVGKTLVLRELERQRPGWTLDLEGLAGHRSSILGMVGLEPCTQKTFDSLLGARLREGFPGPAVIEGESRKVGDTILPSRVWEALQGGTHLLLEAPVERRVEVLIEDYLATEESRAQLRAQLPFIENRLGEKKWAGRLVELLDGGREAELTELLLERYYDPLYAHSEKGRTYAARFDTTDVAACAARIAAWVEARPQAG